ncbi:MAG: ATP-binding protein [Inhella sp.]
MSRPSPPPEGMELTAAPLRTARLLEGSFARLYAAFLAARAALGVALLLVQASGWVLGGQAPSESLALCALYAGLTLVHALLPRLRRTSNRRSLAAMSSPRWWASIGVDLATFTALQALQGGTGLPVTALFFLPVMTAGVLSSRRAALASAAMATLGLLGGLLWADISGSELSPRFMQAGVAGSGYFVVALLTAELAARLAREQLSARGSEALARQQAALNQLVIDEMQEGVLVVDRRLQVRTANPAARKLLGQAEPVEPPPFALPDQTAWAGLVDTVELAFAGSPGAELREVTLGFSAAPARTLRVRSRLTPSGEPEGGEDLCVLLLEDRATLMARMRQERMAAMGRMSAGIAHEIRNPLAAISQANALLAEDVPDPGAQRLTDLVAANVARLKRIVDDVMVLAASPDMALVRLDAVASSREIAQDWSRTQGLFAGRALRLELPDETLPVRFDAEHWRRVLVNLLDNAWRHAQEAAQAPDAPADSPWIVMQVQAEAGGALVRVFNPGPAIRPEIERHLFEPFYSSRSRGSGLGLYICRELCERYRARIDYRAMALHEVPGNAFEVHLQSENPA